MFDNKVDIVKVYGALPPNITPQKHLLRESAKNSKASGKIADVGKKTNRPHTSTFIYKEYQAMRKTDEFWVWWKRQYARQHALCYYCKESLKTKRVNVEHIVPMSRGGTNKKRNMVLSCSDCNKEKGSKLLKSKIRKALRKELMEQIKEDNRNFKMQGFKDTLIADELREIY